jgi:hypothetical protein
VARRFKRNGAWNGRRFCRFCKRRRRHRRSGDPKRKRWGSALGVPMCYVCVARIEIDTQRIIRFWDTL